MGGTWVAVRCDSDVLRGATGGSIVPVTKGLNGLAQVAEQMPSIGDLDRAWGTLTYAVGIGAGTIAGDDFDAWTITQPGGDGGGLAIGQQDRPPRSSRG